MKEDAEIKSKALELSENLQQDEKVRIYRLNKIESDISKVISKLDILDEKLQRELQSHNKQLLQQDNRINLVEDRLNKIDRTIYKLAFIIIVEILSMAGVILLHWLGF
jgi:hypothetical protein